MPIGTFYSLEVLDFCFHSTGRLSICPISAQIFLEKVFHEKKEDRWRDGSRLEGVVWPRWNDKSRAFGESRELPREIDLQLTRQHNADVPLFAPVGFDEAVGKFDDS